MSLPVTDSIVISTPPQLVAGNLATVVFSFTVGRNGMSEGGRLRVALPNPGWAQPLVPQHYFWECFQRGKDRSYTSYDRVNTTAEVVSNSRKAVPFLKAWAGFLEPFSFPRRWLRNYDRWWIEASLEDDGLDAGDQIIVTYGNPDRLPLTARVQGFPDRKVAFLAFVDREGKDEFEEVAGSPLISSVESGPASRMDLIVPSIVRSQQTPQLLLAYTDEIKTKPAEDPEVASLRVSNLDETHEVLIAKKASSIRFQVPELIWAPGDTKHCKIRVEDPQRQWTAESNPSVIRASGAHLFWGDLHAQSQFHAWCPVDEIGIGCGTLEEIYDFAHNVAGLDFCAITDTDSICGGIWPEVRQAALKANQDGQFVVFQATEGGDNVDGHRNILFSSDRPEPSVEPNESHGGASRFAARRAQELYHGREDVLLVYHHTKMWNNWSHWDPTIEAVMEIYSSWGSGETRGTDRWNLSEMSGGAQEAWAKGYRLGVIAGSDTHVGTPGRNISHCERDEMLIFSNGIAGVWAEDLTRESIFGALKRRHCYGTTGVRMILEVFLENHPMGSEVSWSRATKPRNIQINVHGTDALQSLQIIKNNLIVHDVPLRGDSAQICWTDGSDTKTGDYYYVRVTQYDGHRAWSSPIWVDLG